MRASDLYEIIRDEQTPSQISDLLNKYLFKHLNELKKIFPEDSIEIKYLPFDDFYSLVDKEGKSMFSVDSFGLLKFAIDTQNADLAELVLDHPQYEHDASDVFVVGSDGYLSKNIFDYIMSKLPKGNDHDLEKFSGSYEVLNVLIERLKVCAQKNKDLRACLLTHAITSGNLTVAKMAIDSSESDFFNFQTDQTNKGSVRFDNEASVMEYLGVFLSQLSCYYKSTVEKGRPFDTQLECLSAAFCIIDMIFAKDPSLYESDKGQKLDELLTSCVEDELVRGRTKNLVERFGGDQVFSPYLLHKIGLSVRVSDERVDDLEGGQYGGGGGDAASATTDPDGARLSSQPRTSNQDIIVRMLTKMYDAGYVEHAPETGGAAPSTEPNNPSASNSGGVQSRRR